MKNLTVKFAFKAETAGAVRYEEVNEKGKVLTTRDDECVIGALYLRKSQVGTKAPKTLILTIEGSGAVTTEPAKEKKAAPATGKKSEVADKASPKKKVLAKKKVKK
jgi:hypothetical protein